MSVLSDRTIRAALGDGVLLIEPLADNAVQPASVDLRLGPTLKIPYPGQEAEHSKGELPERYREADITGNPWPLGPGESVLGATLEGVRLPGHLVGLLYGRSTVARLFVQPHAAGLLDPGYEGNPTLELTNLGPFKVWLNSGDPICQLMLLQMDAEPSRLYGDPALGSRYQSDSDPTPARVAPDGAP